MIDLYIPDRAFGLPNISPFCMKLEGFLRVADIPHQVIFENNPAKGPKGKVPFIRDNGVTIGDSEIIIDYLEKKMGIDMDGHLSPHQRAIHHTTIRMLEDHTMFAIVYSRWVEPENLKVLLNNFLGEVPPPISTFLGWRFKKGVIKMLHNQGLGRHDREEIYKKAESDIRALSEVLGDHDWFGIDYVSKLDLVAHAFISNLLLEEMPSPMMDVVKSLPNLMDFNERARNAIFPGEFKKERKIPGQSVKLD